MKKLLIGLLGLTSIPVFASEIYEQKITQITSRQMTFNDSNEIQFEHVLHSGEVRIGYFVCDRGFSDWSNDNDKIIYGIGYIDQGIFIRNSKGKLQAGVSTLQYNEPDKCESAVNQMKSMLKLKGSVTIAFDSRSLIEIKN